MSNFNVEEAVERYNPNKIKYYQNEKEYLKEKLKEQEKIRKKYRTSTRGSDIKKDTENITERRKEILSGQQEKRAIKTLNFFTPDEIETKTFLVQSISSSKDIMETFFNYQEDFETGDLKRRSEGNFDEEEKEILNEDSKLFNKSYEKLEQAEIKTSKNYQKLFEKYELIDVHRDDQNGLYVYNFGNKETGQLELFIPGTNPNNPVEIENNNQSFRQVSNAQKAILNYVSKLDEKSKKGEISGKRKYDKGIASINGHSQGGAIAIYGASHIPDISCIASEPGPVVSVGSYVKENPILAVIPNNGNGKFNYAEKIFGSEFSTMHSIAGTDTGQGENQTSLITALPVEGKVPFLTEYQKKVFFEDYKKGKKFDFSKTHFYHFPIPENTGKALKIMQEYSKKVEPKLNKFLESENKKKNFFISELESEMRLQNQIKELKPNKTNERNENSVYIKQETKKELKNRTDLQNLLHKNKKQEKIEKMVSKNKLR